MPNPDGTISWRELQREAVDRLRAAGVASAESEARHLVAEAAGATPAELPLVYADHASERGVARFDDMLARRCSGEPLQYVLGRWGFRSLDLMVDRRVLIPRPETEVVVEVALAELDRLGGRDRPTTVVDLGTGSGAIALSVASERVRSTVWASDVSPDAVAVARANLAGLGRAAARVRVVEGSWFEALPAELRGRVDLVVSNPPYVATTASLGSEVADFEPTAALLAGPDGTDDLRTIIAGAGAWLSADGVVVCELSPEQAESMRAFASERFAEVEVHPDLAGRDRALVARHRIS